VSADCLLTVDLGTTALKTTLFDSDCRVLASATREYQARTLDAVRVEMDPEVYWEALRSTVAEILASSGISPGAIGVISWSSQSETLVVVGRDGKALRPVIVWSDNRATAEADQLTATFGDEAIYRTTGQVSMVPTWPAPKILWLRHNEPEVFKRVHKFLLLEDYFISRLTGRYVCEGSLITSTTYWDVTTKRWWPEMLDTLGIQEKQLPEIMESGEPVATLLPAVAAELGLSSATLVCTGALDQAAGAIGVGNLAPGGFSESTGGCVGICVPVAEPIWDPDRRMPIQYYALPDRYMAHSFTTGGLTLRWLRDTFGQAELVEARATGVDAYDLLTREADLIPPGCEGMLMLPHLQGSLAPDVNPRARGVFFGFTSHHRRAHFTRAVLEAIAFVIRRNLEVIEGLGMPVDTIRVLSGGSRSAVWNQIKADVTGRDVERAAMTEASSLGAALLGGKAAGWFPTVEDGVARTVRIVDRYEPDLKKKEIYDATYQRYRAVNDMSSDLVAR
jgi:sugar (pentulose or hexulose) kinase